MTKAKPIISALLLTTIATTTQAGIRRHDRDDALYQALANESQFGATARLQIGADTCSGTLINSEWLITAAHCFDNNEDALTLAFFDNGAFGFADQVVINPDWLPGQITQGSDLALVHFSTPINTQQSANIYTGSNELGALGTGVGYGRAGTGLTGEIPGTLGTKRAGTNFIDVLGSDRGFHQSILLTDFDSPIREQDSTYGSAIPTDLEYQVAPGDSGGALYIQENGQYFLAGITSFTNAIDGDPDGDYGDMSAYTRLSDYNAWINSVIPAPSGLLVIAAGVFATPRRRNAINQNA